MDVIPSLRLNSTPLFPLFALLVVVLAAASVIFHYTRAGILLDRWAAENGYRILHRELRRLRRGPFFFTTSTGQEVYRVTVEDLQGGVRSGYVRCGSWVLGMLSSNMEVRWDEPPIHRPGFPVVFPPDRGE